VLAWLASSDRDTRLSFLKKFASCMRYEELKPAVKIIDGTKKRKSPNKSFVYQKRKEKRQQQKSERNEESPCEEKPNEESTCSSDAAPTSNLFAQMPAEDEPDFWWNRYDQKDIVAIDCEMVSLIELNQFNKHIEEAAKVAIVDWEGNKHEVRIFTACMNMSS